MMFINKNDLTDMITNCNISEPFFLYLPLHNVYAPYQAPDEWLDKYSVNSTCQNVKFIKQWLV